MKRDPFWPIVAVVIGSIGVAWGIHKAHADVTSAVPYQGQNVGRYQMYYSPWVRQDTFVVDSSIGKVYQQEADTDGTQTFVELPVESLPPVADGKTGRFVIYFSPNVRADTYLMDTATGSIYQMAIDKDGGKLFQPLLYHNLLPPKT